MKLSELSENDFIIEYNRWVESVEPDYDWVIECFKESMAPYVTDIGSYWRGFWSQGDGASFSGRVDLLATLDHIDTDNKHYLYRELMRAGELDKRTKINARHTRYFHEETMSLGDVDYNTNSWVVKTGPLMGLDIRTLVDECEDPNDRDADADEAVAALVLAGAEDVLEWLKNKARELYRNLEAEYEHQTSREAFIEWSEANEN